EDGIVKGGYRLRSGGGAQKPRVALLGRGTILRECLAAAEVLEDQFCVASGVFSLTSFIELRGGALECPGSNLLHPAETPRVPYVQTLFAQCQGPIIAATDYVRNVPDQIRQWVSSPYVCLGTDGYGRSDARAELRRHFEVDRPFIALTALRTLA